MKHYTEAQVDHIIKIKFGELVGAKPPRSYMSDAVLARIYKCSPSQIRRLYMSRFKKLQMKDQPLLEQLSYARDQHDR